MSLEVVVKERFPKAYRHPKLDAQLSQQRLKAELKALDRCRKLGIRVPTPYFAEPSGNRIIMEAVADSETVRSHICAVQAAWPSEAEFLPRLRGLAEAVGRLIGRLHKGGLVHGDLTTSNILMRQRDLPQELPAPKAPAPAKAGGSEPAKEEEDFGLVLIDFGLSSVSSTAEDKGVDLYVLEKALVSTHPATEALFEALLGGYAEGHGKGADGVLKKLNDVRQRGRKRDMVG